MPYNKEKILRKMAKETIRLAHKQGISFGKSKQLSYGVIFIYFKVTTCFGPYSGPSSDHS